MGIIRIAQAQINPTVGDLKGNVELISGYMEKARKAGADLVTFPELSVCGYPPEDLLFKPRFLKDVQDALRRVVHASRGVTAVVGVVERGEAGIHNSAVVVRDGRLLGVYRKLELPNYGVFDEMRYFTPGRGCLMMDLDGVRVMITICEDIWVQGDTCEQCAMGHQVQMALNISASPFRANKLAVRREIVAGFAGRTGCYVCYNNLVGGQDELVFDGGSLVMNPQGETVAAASRFKEDFLVTDLELAPQSRPPLVGPPHMCLELAMSKTAKPAGAPPPKPPVLARVEEIYESLVLGLGDYMRKNGFQKAVLGLSGGIDSALTAALAVEALGAENVVGVTMPSQYTSEETRSDAHTLAENLGIKIITAPIEGILNAYVRELGPVLGDEPLGVTGENLQARIRGNILMALSNRFGWLVMTTGNKSETAVGYCTLYGDMAGGFAVIKDVPKTMVYKLAEYVNQRAEKEVVPASIMERPPSAELRPDQKDEDSLPPYEVLDPILAAYVEEDKVLDDIVQMGYDPKTVAEVARLVDLNEYKRRQAPPGLKISPKAFGKDRRMPITNRYRPGFK